MRAMLALVLVVVAGCAPESGRQRVSLPVHGAGTDMRTFTAGDWTVTLDDARIAWGPAYFCTTPFADVDLCPEALAELRAAATIDALDPSPQVLGELDGLSGTARSVMFDYGISWLLPATMAAPDPGAVDGAHSAHFAGTAVRGTTRLRFVADVDMVPLNSGINAAHGVPVMHRFVDDADALTVRVDPSAILAGADWDELTTLSGDPIVLDESTTLYQSIVIGLSSTSLPTFEWASTR